MRQTPLEGVASPVNMARFCEESIKNDACVTNCDGESGLAERAFCRGDTALQPLVRHDSLAERTGRALEAALHDVMAVGAVEIFDMQADTCVLGERLEPFFEQFGVHVAELRLRDRDLPDQIGPV